MIRVNVVVYTMLSAITPIESVFGQDIQATNGGDNGATDELPKLEEVIVSAQKRQQNLQSVGIAINSISGQTLAEMGVYNSIQVADKVPNLTMVSPSGEGGVVSTFIRGIGLNDYALNNSGPVGYYVDGSLIGSTNAQLTTLFDIERVEVLKGPQGTLFGRNTTGGALNIISNKPTSHVENNLILGVDQFSNYRSEGVLSGPLNAAVNGRLAVLSSTNGGYIENASNGDTVRRQNLAARSLFDIQLSPQASLLLNLHGSKLDGDAELYGNTANTGDFYRNTHGDRPYTLDVESSGLSAQLEWALSDKVQLVSVSSFDQFNKRQDEELDTLPSELIEFEYNADLDTLAQELRLQGNTETTNWVTGVYLLRENNQWLMNLNLVDLPIDPINFPNLTFGTPVLQGEQTLTTSALFGQLEYEWSRDWSVVMGLRYTDLMIDFEFDANAPSLAIITPFTGILSSLDISESQRNQDMSGKLAINYRPTPEALYYASVTRGFKGGGFNGGVVNDFNNYPARAEYQPETLTAYEIGTKRMFRDDTLRLNLAAFYYDYRDAQVYNSTVDPIFGIAQNVVENADALELYGLDIDADWQINSALFFQVGLGYTHSEFSKYLFSVPTRVSAPLAVDIAGETPQNTPELNLHLLANYTWHLGVNGTVKAQVDGTYQSNIYFSNGQMLVPGDVNTYDRNESLGQSGYSLWNARLSWARANNKMEIGLWSQNLTDKEYRAYMLELDQFFGFDQIIRGVPRNIGIDLRYQF